MNLDRSVFAGAGTLILLSVILSQVHSVYWLGFNGFIGFVMLQSAFTGFCPMALVLKKLGVKPGNAFN